VVDELQEHFYCRAFDSFAPALSPDGLPVYGARVPAAPFCDSRKRLGVAQAPTICQQVKRGLGEKHEH
jgi:hypothetical protein